MTHSFSLCSDEDKVGDSLLCRRIFFDMMIILGELSMVSDRLKMILFVILFTLNGLDSDTKEE